MMSLDAPARNHAVVGQSSYRPWLVPVKARVGEAPVGQARHLATGLDGSSRVSIRTIRRSNLWRQ
jgi:hypothetical protein